MTKDKRNRIEKRVLLVLAVLSFIVTFAAGIYLFRREDYTDWVIRYLLILQNSIKAFTFSSDLTLSEISELIVKSDKQMERAFFYAYSIALFIAPYCTFATVYKLVETVFRLKTWRLFQRNKISVIIFGNYNEIEELLIDDTEVRFDKKRYRIHLVTKAIKHEEELGLNQKGIVVHKADILKLSDTAIKSFFKRIELKKARYIFFYDESAEENLAVYNLFNSIRDEWGKELFNEKVKIFCRAESMEMRNMIEAYYDRKANYVQTSDKDNSGSQKKITEDFEIISSCDIAIRELFKEKPLHAFYTDNNIPDPKSWDLHLLIVGFGNLGQQLLLQAMSMGVVSSKNRIIVDVVDVNIEERKNLFLNNFKNEYIDSNTGEIIVSSEKVDGYLKIRFHQADVRYKTFYPFLMQYGAKEQGGKFTYTAICTKDIAVSNQCISSISRYYKECGEYDVLKAPCIAVRASSKRQVALYSDFAQSNIQLINEGNHRITIDNMIAGELDKAAKQYNFVYSNLNICEYGEKVSFNEEDEYNRQWMKMAIRERNSSRAIAQHADIKEVVFSMIDKSLLEKYFGREGEVLCDKGFYWEFTSSNADFLKKQGDTFHFPILNEVSVMEHRRWCYYSISCGWGRTKDKSGKTDEQEKLTPCLCTWSDLVCYQSKYCKYDIMWLLLKYRELFDVQEMQL